MKTATETTILTKTIPAETPTAPAPNFKAIKTKQHAAWAAGDYSIVGVTLQIVGERLCEALDVRSGQRLLDVAAGNGNVSLAAARRFCDVTSSDYVEALLERGRERAASERLSIEFKPGDAEALPFPDGSFDVVTSSFGVMFTPNQERAAGELVRVCRPGGKIGLANWTPEGFIGQLFKTIGRHVSQPTGVKSPALWGTQARLNELFAAHSTRIDITPQTYAWRYRSADHWLDMWRTVYGPLQKAFGTLDSAGQDRLTAELLALIARFNIVDDGTMVVHGDYLEVVVHKRPAA